jgi:5-oxoprolinase (ATP-hydrolysing) subunit B
VIRAFGEGALLVDAADAGEAQSLAASIGDHPPAGLRAVVPGRRTVLVEFDPLIVEASELAASLEGMPRMPAVAAGRLRAIPVVYDGPDLASVAELAERDEDEVIDLHTATELRVLFCGFAPGFAYLGDVAAPLAVPRLPTPRARTPAGSVALADGMSGIYPAELPGGWRVIGRTPLVLFDPRRDPPAYLVPGDRVRFERIGDGDWDARGGEADDW